MAPRHPKVQAVEAFTGFDSLNDKEGVGPDVWIDSSNFALTITGNAIALRSPANFNDILTTTTGTAALSGAFYDRAAGPLILWDIQAVSSTNVVTYVTTGGTNTVVRSGQANARWQSVNVNDRLFRVNGTEFVQVVTSLAVYNVGIAAPAAAPTVTIQAGGAGDLTAGGVSASYAYINTALQDVGQCSPASALSGNTSGGNNTLRAAVIASTQTGVSGIVLYVTADGGSVRYLLTDSIGDPRVFPNTTGNIDVSVILLFTNLNVEETFFSAPPPADGKHLSTWNNRLMLCGFPGATTRQNIAYSGFDQISYGTPWCAWPELNLITIPNKGESVFCGIETPIGWLGLSNRTAYLLTGVPTDKVDSGENVLQVTEQLNQLGWQIGTRSPLTLLNTPFGSFWLDQYKHMQFWPWEGVPSEVCMGLRPDLEAIQDTDAALAMAEAAWFPSGKYGGFIVLTGSTSGATNNHMWIVTVAKQGANLAIGGGPSTIAAQCVFVWRNTSGVPQILIGVTDRLRKILDFDTQGAGWPSGTDLFFDLVSNNDDMFSLLYSMRYDGLNEEDFSVVVMDLDEGNQQSLAPAENGGSTFARVNRYGTRQRLRFSVFNNDLQRRELQNLRLATSRKKRVI